MGFGCWQFCCMWPILKYQSALKYMESHTFLLRSCYTCNCIVSPRFYEFWQVLIYEIDVLPIITRIAIPQAAHTGGITHQFCRGVDFHVQLKEFSVSETIFLIALTFLSHLISTFDSGNLIIAKGPITDTSKSSSMSIILLTRSLSIVTAIVPLPIINFKFMKLHNYLCSHTQNIVLF